MLHILFAILKIIGLIIVVVLGIILVLLTVILFVPIHYQLDGDKDSENNVEDILFYAHWMGRIFHAQARYKDKQFNKDSYFLGRRIHATMRWRNIKIVKYVETKAREIIKKKYTLQEFYDIMKMIPEATVGLYEFIDNSTHQAAFRCFKREFLVFWQYLKPKHLTLKLLYGADDPYETGKAMSLLSILYAWYGDNIKMEFCYDDKITKADCHLKGSVCIYRLVVFIFRLYFDEAVLKTYQDLNKIAEA